jgi:3-oxoacyl-(acyl-carrier-protein) synthase
VRRLSDDDVALVGTGAATPAGPGWAALAEAVAAGRAVAAALDPDDGAEDARAVARVPEPHLRVAVPEAIESQAKFLNASGALAVTAAAEAWAAAGLSASAPPEEDRGLFLAQFDLEESAYLWARPAVVEATERFSRPVSAEALNAATLRSVRPFYLLDTLMNNAFSFTAALLGLRGANTSLSGSSATGVEALGLAAEAVRRGDAAVALALSAARLTNRMTRHEMHALGRLPPGRPGAEGAAAAVLERIGAARARGAKPAAALVGHGGASGDASGEGLARALADAIREALDEAGAVAGEVALVAGDPAAPEHAAALALCGVAGGVATVDSRRSTGEMGSASALADALLAASPSAGAPAGLRLATSVGDGMAVATLWASAP